MLRPSSMIGLLQKEQRTLHGSLCSLLLLDGSYHSRSWWPWVKLMSSLWKMAAHWNGAAASDTGQQRHLCYSDMLDIPCWVWQVVQWHSLLPRGTSRLS